LAGQRAPAGERSWIPRGFSAKEINTRDRLDASITNLQKTEEPAKKQPLSSKLQATLVQLEHRLIKEARKWRKIAQPGSDTSPSRRVDQD